MSSFDIFRIELRMGIPTNPPNIRHPQVRGYSLSNAITAADDWVRIRYGMTRKLPDSLEETRQLVMEIVDKDPSASVPWLAALDVLDAAIDGVDISSRYRVREGECGSVVLWQQRKVRP